MHLPILMITTLILGVASAKGVDCSCKPFNCAVSAGFIVRYCVKCYHE